MSGYKIDHEGFVIKEEPEVSIYLPGEFYWNWRLHHCPVFHTTVTSGNANVSTFKERIISPKTQESDRHRLTILLVRLEESTNPEVRNYLAAARRSLDSLGRGQTAVKVEVKSEYVDHENLTEENIKDDGESIRYTNPWDLAIDPQEDVKRITDRSESYCPVESMSKNARQGLSNSSMESTTTTQSITLPSRSTEFKIKTSKRDTLPDNKVVKVKYNLENFDLLGRRTGQFQCDTCKRRFNRKSLLIWHKKGHIESGHKCKICGMKTNQQSYLTIHMMLHTGKKPQECHMCGKKFANKTSLKSHMLTHTGERPHKCLICQKRFTQSASLSSHMLTHTEERPHECQICEKTFAKKNTLNRHILFHAGKKPHKCHICDKTFARKEHVESHMLTHTGERPHKCYICEKTFTRKRCLKIHILTHTREKPHKCEICKNSFAHKTTLNGHMLIHTGETPHKCRICFKLFAHEKIFSRHILSHIRKK